MTEVLAIREPLQEMSPQTPNIEEWQIGPRTINGLQYALASRHVEEGLLEHMAPFSNLASESRLIGVKWTKPPKIAILVRGEIKNEDIGVISRIEKDLKEIKDEAEADTKTSLTLSFPEQVVIKNFGKPYKVIAHKLGVEPSTIRTHFHGAKAKNKMNKEQLVVTAFKQGLIDTSILPTDKNVKMLTPRERDVLGEGVFCPAPELAKLLGLKERTVRTHLHNIYLKLGVASRDQAVLMALRDGLIG